MLRWGEQWGRNALTLAKVARQSKRVPAALRDRPVLPDWCTSYYRAFLAVVHDRTMNGNIPYCAISAYCGDHGLDVSLVSAVVWRTDELLRELRGDK